MVDFMNACCRLLLLFLSCVKVLSYSQSCCNMIFGYNFITYEYLIEVIYYVGIHQDRRVRVGRD